MATPSTYDNDAILAQLKKPLGGATEQTAGVPGTAQTQGQPSATGVPGTTGIPAPVTGATQKTAVPGTTGIPAPVPADGGGASKGLLPGEQSGAPKPGETGGVTPLPPMTPAPPDGLNTSPGVPSGQMTTTPRGYNADPTQALASLAQLFQSRTGRAMTPAEQQQLIAASGYTSGQVTPQQYEAAQNAIYQNTPGGPAPAPGTPGTPPPGGAPAPAPGNIDPNVAMNQAINAFAAKFGRAMTPQEQQALLQALNLQPGQPITQAILDQALGLIGKYSGDIANPWGPPAPTTPAPTTPTPENPGGPGLPSEGTKNEADARLLELLSQQWGEVDPNDPALKGQRDSFELANQRATTRKRAALAERAAARGGIGAGGYDVDTERLLSEEGESNTAFGAKLYADELKDQRSRLMEGIRIATQAGLQQEAQKLQEELAKLDIKLRATLGQGQLGLGLLNSNRQDQQFYDNLGFLLAKLGVDMDNDSIMAILNGG